MLRPNPALGLASAATAVRPGLCSGVHFRGLFQQEPLCLCFCLCSPWQVR